MEILEISVGGFFRLLVWGLGKTVGIFLLCLLFGMAVTSVRFYKTSFVSRLFDILFAFFLRIPPHVGLTVFLWRERPKDFAVVFLFLYFLPQVSDSILRYLHGREENLARELAGVFCELWRTFYLYLVIYDGLNYYLRGVTNHTDLLARAALALLIYWAIGLIAEKALPRLFQRKMA